MITEQNRNEAYFDLIQSENLNQQQEAILRQLHLMPNLTDLELAEFLGMDKNVVNARRYELEKLGLIYQSGSKLNKESGKMNTTFAVCNSYQKGEQTTQESINCISSRMMDLIEKNIRKANEHQKNLIRGWLN